MTGRVGKYEILGIIGSSASGETYLASDPVVDRRVAVKQLAPSLSSEPGFMDTFRVEAGSRGRLDHLNCVRVYDYFEDETGAYVVSEHVAGASLRNLLDANGRLGLQQSLGVARGALSGLASAHELGLVHRDLKPENLLADQAGTVKLADFGQAFFTGELAGADRPSTGIAAYMSPEQVRGEQGDVRADIYSLAVVLYEFLAGRPPFLGLSRIAVMKMHLEREPPDLNRVNPRVPVEVSRVLHTALSKDPSGRYSSAGEFLAFLEEVARDAWGAAWLESASISHLVDEAHDDKSLAGITADPGGVKGRVDDVGEEPQPPPGAAPEPVPEPPPAPEMAVAPRRPGGPWAGIAAAIAGLLSGAALGAINGLAGQGNAGLVLPAALALAGLVLAIAGLQLLRRHGVAGMARRVRGVLATLGGAGLLGYGGVSVIRILIGS